MNKDDGLHLGYKEFFNIQQMNGNCEDVSTRKSFRCLSGKISSQNSIINDAEQIVEEIYPYINKGKANSSQVRSEHDVKINILMGVIAEMVCETFLKNRYCNKNIKRNIDNISVGQIDISLLDKSIEVRSSCVNNGIEFALFKRDANNNYNTQYFDVIGPYTNWYKPCEEYKDYYVRALFDYPISEFEEKILHNKEIELYITGGATKLMMSNSEFYHIKTLSPKQGVILESNYKVIPFSRSLDIFEFISILEKENPALAIKSNGLK